MKLKISALISFYLAVLTLYSQSAQLPNEDQLYDNAILDENRAELMLKDDAEIGILLANAPSLEKILNQAIAQLSREYARHNQKLQELITGNASGINNDAIADKQSTIQDIEQQQIMRIKQLKSLLDYLEELRYQLFRTQEDSTLNA